MKIFITGINGFIGSHLARYLVSGETGLTGEIKIYGCSIESSPRPGMESLISGYHRLTLGETPPAGIFDGIDAIVHCAYSYDRKNILSDNIEGTKQWFRVAREQGVLTQVFLTSYSAKENSGSVYGRIKYELEGFFMEQKQPVIRPGLVLGNGGLFARMSKLLTSLPFIPLLDGGNYEVPIISVEALCQVIAKVIQNPGDLAGQVSPTGGVEVQAFQERMVTMKELLQGMKRQLGAWCLFIPIPSILPLIFLKLLEALHIPFPIKSSSIVALKENQALSITSSLQALGIVDASLEEILRPLAPPQGGL